MRKFWGWLLFLFVIFVARLTQINLSGQGNGDINWVIVTIWWLAGVASLFGWYKLAISKPVKEANNANR